MLPEQFSEEELFLKIAGLSFQGDFRMWLGENPHKVFNIVYAQMDAFRMKYTPVIEDLPNVNYISSDTLQQDMHVKLRGGMLQALPASIRDKTKSHHLWYLSRDSRKNISREEPSFCQSIVSSPEIDRYVEKALGQVVGRPAITQSLKGLLSAGFVKSVSYGLDKIKKKISSKNVNRKSSQ